MIALAPPAADSDRALLGTETAPLARAPRTGGDQLHQRGVEVLLYVGPTRGEATAAQIPLPGATPGDVTIPVGYVEVGAQASALAGRWEGHEQVLTITPARDAFDTALWQDEAWVIVRARWRDDLGNWTPWQALFVGNVVADEGGAEGRARTRTGAGSVTCRQEWFWLDRRPLPPLSYGVVDAAEGASASADSTLANPASENGVEYLSASSVAPDMATDGNIDTVWVSANLADGAGSAVWTLPPWTGKQVKIAEVYNGSAGGGIGTNGLPRYVAIYAADGRYYNGFEANDGGPWTTHYGAAFSRTNNPAWVIRQSWSLLVRLPGWDAGISQTWTNLTPELECVVRFSIRAESLPGGQPQAIQALVAGMGSTHVADLMLSTTPREVVIRHQASSNGTINLRFKSRSHADYHILLDDIFVVGGVKMADGGQPYARLWLVWEDGLGGSGYADLQRAFGLEEMAAETWAILTDDADLFAARFDPGPDAQVIQYREVPGLRGMDFASGRGRLRLAYYRRWPDLPGSSEDEGDAWEDVDPDRRWDDLKINLQPAFAVTAALRRNVTAYPQTGVSTVVMTNPAPAGDATGAATWLDVDLGDYPATSLQLDCGAAAGEVVIVESTDGYPAGDYGWLDTERVYYQVTGPTTVTLALRGLAPGPAAVAHAAGSRLWPDQGGTRITAPLIAVVGVRRRHGVPRLIDFTILGSRLPSPADPSTGALVYESHPDWFPLATVRNNASVSPTYLLGARPGDVAEIAWPPPVGTAYPWGRECRHIRVIVQRMERWQGAPQRAKLNGIVAYAADLASAVGGGYAGSAPPDLKDVAANILTTQAGLAFNRLTIWRGEVTGLPWGRHYGRMQTAAGSAAEVLQRMEALGGLRIACRPDGTIEIAPDPLTTAASMQAVERFWTPAMMSADRLARSPVRAVAQARVSARNRDTGQTFAAAYPRTPRAYGEVLEEGDLILGDQQATTVQAQRLFRQRNARGSMELQTWLGPPPTPGRRHVVEDAALDAGGTLLGGTNMLVDAYAWSITGAARRAQWTLTVQFGELAPWA